MSRRFFLGLGLGSILRAILSAWVNPPTRSTNDLINATIWNQDVVANTQALKNPPSDQYTANESSDYAGTGSWADVDATNWSFSVTTTGGDVMVHFDGTVYTTGAAANVQLDVAVDGTRDGGDDGYIKQNVSATPTVVSFTRLITGLTAGSHTFTLQWLAGTVARMAAGSGGSHDVHPQFWVREVS